MSKLNTTSLLKTLFTIVLLLSTSKVFALSFDSGNIYGTRYNNITITEYDSSGNIISTLIPNINSSYTRGMTFGTDGLLYIVAQRPNNESFGFTVYALDETGFPQKSWTNTSAYIGGNIAFGKISFDANGFFYVGSGAGLHKFDSASQNPDAIIFGNGVYDVDVLPNGEIILATDYEVFTQTHQVTSSRQLDTLAIHWILTIPLSISLQIYVLLHLIQVVIPYLCTILGIPTSFIS